METNQNGRLSKIEELLVKHDERMTAHEEQMKSLRDLIGQHDQRMAVVERALENTERLLVIEGDRLDRSERIEARQNELFGEISEQLKNMGKS
jgi:hypothetical protein